MKLEELMADSTVTHVRREYWALPDDHIILPPFIDGCRGPWFTLVAFDGVSTIKVDLPLVTDSNTDWVRYEPKGN